MNTKHRRTGFKTAFRITICAMIFSFSVLFSCFNTEEDIVLWGMVKLPGPVDGPVFVIVAKSYDIENLNADDILAFESVYTDNKRYSIDLSGTGLKAGDAVSIFAFADNDYGSGIPFPTTGDDVGFYFEDSQYSIVYRLQAGINANIDIDVNKKWFSSEAIIKFLLYDGFCPVLFDGIEQGTHYALGDKIVIYAIIDNIGILKNISVSDVTLDMNYIIGSLTVEITESSLTTGYYLEPQVRYREGDWHELKLFPFIYNGITVGSPFEINNVTLIMFLDNGGTPGGEANGKVDIGSERIGYLGQLNDVRWWDIDVNSGVNTVTHAQYPAYCLGFQPFINLLSKY
ncbi:MAG: hypothetical protein GY754_30535 [bacterium]|nr:hypothetical protein [bacterium]